MIVPKEQLQDHSLPKDSDSNPESDTLPPLLNVEAKGYVRQNDGVTKIEALCMYSASVHSTTNPRLTNFRRGLR